MGSYALVFYITVAILIVTRFSFHVIFRLDEYDWRHSKSTIWTNLFVAPLFWPLLLFRPRNIWDPTELFEGEYRTAARAREIAKAKLAIPRCGRYISFAQDQKSNPDASGEFTILARDVEESVRKSISENSDANNEEGAEVLSWVMNSDDSIMEPTPVPAVWSHFESVVSEIVRAGQAKIHCTSCGRTVPTSDLKYDDDSRRPGWNFDRIRCSNNHSLLEVKRIHLLMARKQPLE